MPTALAIKFAALLQCNVRGIDPGPINYLQGMAGERAVSPRGRKAIWLCMPLTRKKKNQDTDEEEQFVACFVWRPNWFVLAQTEGEPVPIPEIPDWNRDHALAALNIEEIPFKETDGNVQEYAHKSQVAISPIDALPAKTFFYEAAHVVLGHTQETSISDSERTPKDLREVEAEAVAHLLCQSLGLPGAQYCCGYIQSWLNGQSIPESRLRKSSEQPTEF